VREELNLTQLYGFLKQKDDILTNLQHKVIELEKAEAAKVADREWSELGCQLEERIKELTADADQERVSIATV